MIYIITHKDVNNKTLFNLPDYEPLYVGSKYCYGDKDNINYLNPYINELTGLYYIWKNCNEDIVGLVHYRRGFLSPKTKHNLSMQEANNILQEYDLICTSNYSLPSGIIKFLAIEMRDINKPILYKYYDMFLYYEPRAKNYFEHCLTFNPKNMFISKKEVINKYCEWLFPILIPMAEKFVKEDINTVTEPRLLGFFAERLFTYWINKNDLNCKKLDVIQYN